MKKGVLILLFAILSIIGFILERYLFNGTTIDKPLYLSYLISFVVYFTIYVVQLKYCKSISPVFLGGLLLFPQILFLIWVIVDKNLHFRVPSIYPIITIIALVALLSGYLSYQRKKQKVAVLLFAFIFGVGLYYNFLVVPSLFDRGLRKNDDKIRFSDLSFSLVNDVGERIESSTYKHKTILIEFWFKDCLPCIQKMKVLDALRAQFGKDTNIVFITINSGKIDSYSTFQKAVAETPYTNFINLYDSAGVVVDKLEITTFPEEVIIHKMKPVRVFKGWYSMELSETYSTETQIFLKKYTR